MTIHRTMLGTAAVAGMAVLLTSCQQTREKPPRSRPRRRRRPPSTTISARWTAGRALALSQDGARATYYICQSRLWKNCDNYELNDRFVSVPSAKLAAREALARCGGCGMLYLNDQRQR